MMSANMTLRSMVPPSFSGLPETAVDWLTLWPVWSPCHRDAQRPKNVTVPLRRSTGDETND